MVVGLIGVATIIVEGIEHVIKGTGICWRRNVNSRNRELSGARLSTAKPLTIDREKKYVNHGTCLDGSTRKNLFLLSVNSTPSKLLTEIL